MRSRSSPLAGRTGTSLDFTRQHDQSTAVTAVVPRSVNRRPMTVCSGLPNDIDSESRSTLRVDVFGLPHLNCPTPALD
ncbi:MAG TPA: hypothetical protein DDY91_16960 [Planctomycetaceae bacterium]|nr:hypothetical protein [Planctomycetaceae bacterium]